MKRLLLVIAFALLLVAIGGVMRTPITKPGFDNIPTLIELQPVGTSISNNAAETNLYVVTIPRNTLGLTDRVVKVTLEYQGLNDSGAARTIVWRVYYGTSAALVLPTDTWAAGPNLFAGTFTVYLINGGTVADQDIYARDERVAAIVNTDSWVQESNKELDLTISIDFDAAHADLVIYRMIVTTVQMAP